MFVRQPEDYAAMSVTDRTECSGKFERLQKAFLTIQMPSIVGTVGTQMGMFGLHALHSVILARMLGPHGRGEYGTAVLFTQILTYSGMLGTSFSIARRAGTSSDDLGALGNASLRVGVITGLISFSLVSLLALSVLPESKAYLAPLCMASALLLPFEHARLALLSVDHGSGTFGRYNLNRLVAALVFPILLCLAWAVGVVSVTTATWLSVVTSVISLVALIRSHKNLGFFLPSIPSSRTLLREGVPYATSYFAGQLLGRIDTLLVLWLLDFTQQGYYAVAVAASSLMQVVPNALSLYSFNIGASIRRRMPKRQLLLAAFVVFLAQVGSAIGMGVVLVYFLPLIFGDKFVQAIPFAIALLPGLAIDGLANVAEGYLRGCGRPLSTLLPRTIGSLALVLSAYALFPTWDSLSIPIASSIGYTVSGLAILGMVAWYQTQPVALDQEAGS